ncbi:MAG: flavin reductase family protein [Acidimicrobiia bacterium]
MSTGEPDVSGAFDRLVAGTDGAMVVVTVDNGDQRAGCLVGFHCQASIEPARYAVWLSKANHTYPVALLAEFLAVHVLGAGERDLAVLFGTRSGDETDKFGHCEWVPGPGGVPLLERCPDRMVLRRRGLIDVGGDHVCVVGEPVAAWAGTLAVPLRLSALTDLDPGHDAGERR